MYGLERAKAMAHEVALLAEGALKGLGSEALMLRLLVQYMLERKH